jgi:hypothetical protein
MELQRKPYASRFLAVWLIIHLQAIDPAHWEQTENQNNWGFQDAASNARYNDCMKTCFYMFNHRAWLTAGIIFCDQTFPAGQERDDTKDALKTAWEQHYNTHLRFLPFQRTGFKSIGDLTSTVPKIMRDMKAAEGILGRNDFDRGYGPWVRQHTALFVWELR